MKNKNFLNVCYKYFNRYISGEELVEKLKTISMEENFINEIEQIIKNTPDFIDEYTIKEKETIKK